MRRKLFLGSRGIANVANVTTLRARRPSDQRPLRSRFHLVALFTFCNYVSNAHNALVHNVSFVLNCWPSLIMNCSNKLANL